MFSGTGTQGHGPAEIEQHLDDPVDPVDLLEEHVGVLAPARLVGELAPQELDGAADGAERISDLVGEAHRDLPGRGQRLAPAHLGLELVQPRDVAHDRDRGLDRALFPASGAVTMLTCTARPSGVSISASASERLSPVASVSLR